MPPTFVFDPNSDPLVVAKRLAEDVRADVLRRIEAQQQELVSQGWQPLPARLRNRDDLKRFAKRLYLRAVEGWSWRKIADAEGPGVEEEAVRMSVREWAAVLDVELPKFATGRPRKRKG
jgi:hypothetical protein